MLEGCGAVQEPTLGSRLRRVTDKKLSAVQEPQASHGIDGFTCGRRDLDEWFHKYTRATQTSAIWRARSSYAEDVPESSALQLDHGIGAYG